MLAFDQKQPKIANIINIKLGFFEQQKVREYI